jgi:hypothetical protein
VGRVTGVLSLAGGGCVCLPPTGFHTRCHPYMGGALRRGEVLKPDTYKLANEDGEELTNAWNIQQLHRFYP